MRPLVQVVANLLDTAEEDVYLSPLDALGRFPDGSRPGGCASRTEDPPPGGRGARDLSEFGVGLVAFGVFVSQSLVSVADGWEIIRAHGDGLDLAGADLRGADLARGSMVGSDLTDADLSRADFSQTNLMGATFLRTGCEGADLHAANLRRIRAERSSFVRANLAAADLRGARILKCGFSGAAVQSVVWEDADIVEAFGLRTLPSSVLT